MNPLSLVAALLRGNVAANLAFGLITAVAVGSGLAMATLERGIRHASARASDDFDIVVGALGSATQLVLTTVYLRPAALDLMPATVWRAMLDAPGVESTAPVALGDFVGSAPLVGTNAALATGWGRRPPLEGRVFERPGEALAGAEVRLAVGARFHVEHGSPSERVFESTTHAEAFTVVGRMPPTGTPWDHAILVPIESVWQMHGLAPGQPGPIPALVVRPKSVADAYALRRLWRSDSTLAVFPAEVLTELYGLLGPFRRGAELVIRFAQVLCGVTLLLSIGLLVSGERAVFATLADLGAPRIYLWFAAWIYAATVLVGGAVAGTAIGWLAWSALANVAGEWLQLRVELVPDKTTLITFLGTMVALVVATAVPALAAITSSDRKP